MLLQHFTLINHVFSIIKISTNFEIIKKIYDHQYCQFKIIKATFNVKYLINILFINAQVGLT